MLHIQENVKVSGEGFHCQQLRDIPMSHKLSKIGEKDGISKSAIQH